MRNNQINFAFKIILNDENDDDDLRGGKEVGLRVMKISLSLSKIIYDSNSSILGFNAVGSCFKMFIMLLLLVPTSSSLPFRFFRKALCRNYDRFLYLNSWQ